MAQKDKVKELVGRGLDSYHTKSLQQIDRIEKKNKEQNHKISILTNELDNDYLTKTEEGSVVSLEHSKEGMVYLDELQGNTLVNYCTDGSKEMTLNGDIDLEGTFVTTTEGVDNGLVDVMCEGNTLVNILKTSGNWFDEETILKTDSNTAVALSHYQKNIDIKLLKSNTLYTVIPYVDYSIVTKGEVYIQLNTEINNVQNGIFRIYETSFNKPTLITTSNLTNLNSRSLFIGGLKCEYKFRSVKILILEGDWTNKEIPPYFEGMNSVGQDDINGHKIEILSQNKNLFNINETDVYSSGTRCEKNGNSLRIIPTSTPSWASYNIKIKGFKNGETYTLSCISDNYHLPKSRIALYERATNTNVGSWDRNYFTIPNNVNVEDIYLRIHCCDQDATNIREVEISDILIEKGQVKTQFIPYVMNKKEILMNEPLRKANDFYRDRLVKIGNKCYIERNTKEVVLDGTHNVAISGTSVKDETLCRFDFTINGLIKGSNGGEDKKFICDKIPYLFIHALAGGSTNVTQECISNHSTNENSLNMVIKKSRLETIDVTGVNKWLSNNNIKIIIPIATPTYESLEIEPILNAYNDVTHFYNNSIIPCNMKVQNSGYNAIIKPSTLYTIALDTNKSGTIGMNLGGTKGTTTNNVLTLTTPATLTDDSLRLYGKGIKGSKVRLLEGDKTNWIPSFFEGMQSSFEDKVQEDGSYKMEILSNNKNLFNKNILEKVNSNYYEIINKDNRRCLKIERPSLMYRTRILNQLKKNTSYKISFDMLYDRIKGNGMAQGASIHIVYTDGSSNSCYASTSYNEWLNASIITPSNKTIHYIQFSYGTNTPTYIDLDTFIIQENNNLVDYVYHKSNKIQFSSIEPLRSVGNIKDRFVFKDGKLIIQRNIGKHFITKDSVLSYDRTNSSVTRVNFNAPNFDTNNVSKIKVLANKYPSGENDKLHGSYVNNVIGITGDKYMRIMLTNLELGISSSTTPTTEHINAWLDRIGGFTVSYQLAEPTYEEMPFELQKIILEGYENGTLFFDTNIPPTSTVTYAGETPIVKETKLNKTKVLNNTNDINDNIIPYLMDMDYRVVCLQLQSENINNGVSMARLFGGTYEMLQRDIQSKRYSIDEYKHRLDAYLGANKITEEEYNKLGDMLNE